MKIDLNKKPLPKLPENDNIGYVTRPVLIVNNVPRWADEYVRELQCTIAMLRAKGERA